LANIKSAIKRAKQNIKRRLHNASMRSMMRSHIKNVLKAIESGDLTAANSAYANAQVVVDKATNKGLVHKNKAARIKRRLVNKVKQLGAGQS